MGGRGSPAPHKGLGTYRHRREHHPSFTDRFHTNRFHTNRFHTDRFHTDRFHTDRFHTDSGANTAPAPHGGAGQPGPP